jgi:CheY-like chemotaxis protein
MRVEFPVVPVTDTADFADTAGAERPEAIDGTPLQGVDVLLVEDDAEASEILAVVLGERGAQVRSARDYDGALQAMQQAWPDVLVSDIGLPGRDGYELVRRVRELEGTRAGARLPVIALTAFARPQDLEKTLAAGFDLHLAKPLKPHMLVEAIARCRRPAPEP